MSGPTVAQLLGEKFPALIRYWVEHGGGIPKYARGDEPSARIPLCRCDRSARTGDTAHFTNREFGLRYELQDKHGKRVVKRGIGKR